MNATATLAVIGGSGIYDVPGLVDVKKLELDTPFGKPSAPIVVGSIENTKIAFLARHGLGHRISPTEVNYRANIYALKSLGVECIVSISACGSLREDFAPGHVVIPDQIYDNTHMRHRSFFGDGLVAHISVAEPFCNELSGLVESAVRSTGTTTHRGGSIITIEGPRFSTKAESNTYRSWGMSVIGMTTSPEAFLAREAEICYSVMAHVTDYDVWHASEIPVTVDMVIDTLRRNTSTAQKAIRYLATNPITPRNCGCNTALLSSLISDPAQISPATKQRLHLLIEKYIE